MCTSRTQSGYIEDLNNVGLMRSGRSDADICMLETWYQDYYRPAGGGLNGLTAESVKALGSPMLSKNFVLHRSRQYRQRPLIAVNATSPLAPRTDLFLKHDPCAMRE